MQIYWTKGFFYGGQLFYTNITLDSFISECPGLNRKFKNYFCFRYELFNYFRDNRYNLIDQLESDNGIKVKHTLNILLSQMSTVNNRPKDLIRLRILRLYLIRSYKGKCHALGKPVHGQRTWSNAWGSYKNNTVLRDFISEVKKQLNVAKVPEKTDYHSMKKKFVRKKKPVTLAAKITRKSAWF